jgi:hypothetical protein
MPDFRHHQSAHHDHGDDDRNSPVSRARTYALSRVSFAHHDAGCILTRREPRKGTTEALRRPVLCILRGAFPTGRLKVQLCERRLVREVQVAIPFCLLG